MLSWWCFDYFGDVRDLRWWELTNEAPTNVHYVLHELNPVAHTGAYFLNIHSHS